MRLRHAILSTLLLAALAPRPATQADPGPAGKFHTITRTFANPAALLIPDGAPSTTAGPASLYPSIIHVSGFKQGKLKDVNLTLANFTHGFPDDVDVLLVAPHGRNAVVMSDVGGETTVVGITLTLDDAAATALPDTDPLTSGVYRPTNSGGGDSFAPPAPAPGSASALATFNGIDPNGDWTLFIMDDNPVDSGNLAGGWALQLRARVKR